MEQTIGGRRLVVCWDESGTDCDTWCTTEMMHFPGCKLNDCHTRLFDFLPLISLHMDVDVCVTEDSVSAPRSQSLNPLKCVSLSPPMHFVIFPDLMMKAQIAVWIGNEEMQMLANRMQTITRRLFVGDGSLCEFCSCV